MSKVARRLHSAEILAVGSELTAGDTRDTNSGELARELTELGVDVLRLAALPDDLGALTAALREALERADLVVTTGGLGPTPDDLSREAIAAVCHEEPAVDPVLERDLRALFERRGVTMPARNRKQAWLIPSAQALENPHGTAPGWWVERPDGRVVVALPGPPREMRPMWRQRVVPRLSERGLGSDRASAVLRLAGVGESHVADLIGDDLLAAANPAVATFARADAIDVRIVARGDGNRPASDVLAATLGILERRLASHVFGRDGDTWADALGSRLASRTVAMVEIGTGGAVTALVGSARWLSFVEVLAAGSALARAHGADLRPFASRVREVAGADLGLAVKARERGGDTAVAIAIADEAGVARRSRVAFQGGEDGRRRAAVLACLELWKHLGVE